jgi:hypothetical protein
MMSKAIAVALIASASLMAQASRTLVVYSSTSSTSSTLANYYKTARSIPAGNMCAVTPPDDTSNEITFAQYTATLRDPIKTCIDTVGRDTILYVVMAWVRPLKFNHPNGLVYSIDSFLADAFDSISTIYPTRPPTYTAFSHPYYVAANTGPSQSFPAFVSLADWRTANPTQYLFSVWRIDGDSSALAQGLIDQAITAESAGGPAGKVCADTGYTDYTVDPEADGLSYSYGTSPMVDWDIYRILTVASAGGWTGGSAYDNKVVEFGQSGAASCSGAAFFGGWYGGAGSRNGTYSWVTGAIGVHVDSYSIGDLRAPYTGATPHGTWGYQELKAGLAATSGVVAEPYVLGNTRTGPLFRNLFVEHARIGDAFLRNTALGVRWMLVQVGDPLYQPWGSPPPARPPSVRTRGAIATRGKVATR